MTETQLAAALKETFSQPLADIQAQFKHLSEQQSAISTALGKFNKTEDDTPPAGGTPPTDDTTEVAALKEQLSKTETALAALTDKFEKALKNPAGATDADEEPDGQDQYSNLL